MDGVALMRIIEENKPWMSIVTLYDLTVKFLVLPKLLQLLIIKVTLMIIL